MASVIGVAHPRDVGRGIIRAVSPAAKGDRVRSKTDSSMASTSVFMSSRP